MKKWDGGVYLIDGRVLIKKGEEAACPQLARLTGEERERARENTISYGILAAHNHSGDMDRLQLRFDALVGQDMTYMGVLVLWALVLLAVLFVGVTASIFKESFPLFRYGVTAVAVLYLALSFGHPDYIVARVNIANAPHGEMLEQEDKDQAAQRPIEESSESGFFLAPEPYQDYAYLRTLSADAALALVPYLKALGYHMEAFHA